MSEDLGYYMGSKEEESQKGGAPLAAEDYIFKVGKITFEKVPTFVKGAPNWSQLTVGFKTICLPFKQKADDGLRDQKGGEVAPLTRFIFRDINPFSTGFQPDGAPSHLRAFVSYMEKVDVSERIKPPGFILVDKDLNEVTDDKLRAAFMEELTNPDAPRDLHGKGYQAFPDIRPYEGRYIAGAVIVDGKGNNKINRFSKLPDSFVPPTEAEEKEAMDKFEESYAKMVAKQKDRTAIHTAEAKGESTSIADEPVVDEELATEDQPF